MSVTAKTNTAKSLREKADRAASCGRYQAAGINMTMAGKLFSEAGEWMQAEQAWRKAMRFCLQEAERIALRVQTHFDC